MKSDLLIFSPSKITRESAKSVDITSRFKKIALIADSSCITFSVFANHHTKKENKKSANLGNLRIIVNEP